MENERCKGIEGWKGIVQGVIRVVEQCRGY